jgi:hypothetical protein
MPKIRQTTYLGHFIHHHSWSFSFLLSLSTIPIAVAYMSGFYSYRYLYPDIVT